MRYLFLLLLSLSLLSSCFDIQTGEPVKKIAPGTWRGAFILEDQAVPVMYEVSPIKGSDEIEVVFKTAGKDLKADKVRVWGDTIFMDFEKANTRLKLIYQIDQMDGFLYDNNGSEYPMVFAGQHAILHRFPDIRKQPTANLTGDWKLQASTSADSILNGNIRFVAKENYLEGTLHLDNHPEILLEGTIQGSKLYLSGFDGKVACLISATVDNPKKLVQGTLKWNNKSLFWEAEGSAGMIH